MIEVLARRPIVIVEDSDIDFELLELCLKRAKVTNPLRRFTDASKAVDYFLGYDPAAGQDIPPCLALVDLNLPGMDGIELVTRLRSNPALRRLALIGMSTSNDPKTVGAFYDAGGNAYIFKETDLDEFEATVVDLANFWLRRALLADIAAPLRFPN